MICSNKFKSGLKKSAVGFGVYPDGYEKKSRLFKREILEV